jgi:c-di-GMP-binding flagellar brake protein YcgR
MKERRKLERFKLKLLGEIAEQTADQMKRVLHLSTRDISSGGAFFYAVNPLPEGTSVKVDLSMSTDRLKRLTGTQAQLQMSGIVKRSEPSGMAIRFNKAYKMVTTKGTRNHRKGTLIKWDLFRERRRV